uniref:Uncharacterized protein n=1 Tax=Arundo donax TaxID=35708 RepID=A0A0A9BSD8_ARUDO
MISYVARLPSRQPSASSRPCSLASALQSWCGRAHRVGC